MGSRAGILCVFLIFFLASVYSVGAQESGVKLKILEAFSAISNSEKSGADISPLVKEINGILETLESSGSKVSVVQEREISAKSDAIVTKSSELSRAGVAKNQERLMITSILVAALGVFAFLVYIYEPRIFWRLWIRTKRNWKVSRND